MKREEFLIELDKLGISLTEVQESQLEKYYQLLVQYNEHMNLTGITEHGEVYLKHFYDSLTLIKAIHLEKVQTLCDVGTFALMVKVLNINDIIAKLVTQVMVVIVNYIFSKLIFKKENKNIEESTSEG